MIADVTIRLHRDERGGEPAVRAGWGPAALHCSNAVIQMLHSLELQFRTYALMVLNLVLLLIITSAKLLNAKLCGIHSGLFACGSFGIHEVKYASGL